jgi:DHA2 family multidrug resistance protein
MVCLMLGPFINILDYNVVNVALPKMMSGLATDILTIRWVVTASLMVTAVVMPTLGWVGRTLGNKNLYILGQPFQYGHLCARSLAVETCLPF